MQLSIGCVHIGEALIKKAEANWDVIGAPQVFEFYAQISRLTMSLNRHCFIKYLNTARHKATEMVSHNMSRKSDKDRSGSIQLSPDPYRVLKSTASLLSESKLFCVPFLTTNLLNDATVSVLVCSNDPSLLRVLDLSLHFI